MSWTLLGELIVIVWFFFHPIIVVGIIYWLVFREWPFPKGYKWSVDLKILNNARKEIFKSLYTESEKDRRVYDADDYWEYEDGEAHANTGPTIRHPKNRDRAYEGSA
jgi:hypothetical protein